jgi:uridine kinase
MKIQKELEKLLQNKSRVIISIDGPSASGKSTFGRLLAEKYNGLLIRTDDYFLSENDKKVTKKEPGWNLDYSRLKLEVFDHLSEEFITSNPFNCKTQVLQSGTKLKVNNLIIIEGVYSQNPIFRGYYDLMVFMEVDSKEQISRIKSRNGDKMLQRWLEEWIPLENQYFDNYQIKKHADFIIKL